MQRIGLIALLLLGIGPKLIAQDQQQHVFNIYFKTNSDITTSESMNAIRHELLTIGPQNIREIKLRGHADSDANDSFNRELSHRRVLNSLKYFMTQGVPERLINFESFGEANPVSELKSMNRRVEITIVYEFGVVPSNLGLKKFWVFGRVSNFNTGRTLACAYVMEEQNLNVFQKTMADGKFYFTTPTAKSFSITFSKEGFLSATIQVNQAHYLKAKNDTVYLDIKMKPIEVIEKIVFDNIFFYSDSDSLKPESKPDLDKLMAILKADKNLFVEIQGHMNCPRSRPLNIYQKRYNHELSHKRAKTIYRYLINRGIPRDQLTFKGMSNENMIYPEPKNELEADKNKRVEVWKLKIVEK